jgi:hypothetical protein
MREVKSEIIFDHSDVLTVWNKNLIKLAALNLPVWLVNNDDFCMQVSNCDLSIIINLASTSL